MAAGRDSAELERRARLYRQGRTPPQVRDRVVIWYVDFAQTLDAEVRALLEQARSPA